MTEILSITLGVLVFVIAQASDSMRCLEWIRLISKKTSIMIMCVSLWES
jgi:hypothetical protein